MYPLFWKNGRTAGLLFLLLIMLLYNIREGRARLLFDWILTKYHHCCRMMIGKIKNTVTLSTGEKILETKGKEIEKQEKQKGQKEQKEKIGMVQRIINRKEIEAYLSDVKASVKKDSYRIDRNAKRQDNASLFFDYVMDEARAKEIILSLTAIDFSEILQNTHKGFEYEQLYVFGKEVTLLERFGTEERTVPLYIKMNRLQNGFVIVISFHEQKYPLTYYFR